MGFYSDALAVVRNAFTTRAAGGQVDSYTIFGQDVRLCELDKLWEIQKDLAKLAADETQQAGGGSRFHFANLRPGG